MSRGARNTGRRRWAGACLGAAAALAVSLVAVAIPAGSAPEPVPVAGADRPAPFVGSTHAGTTGRGTGFSTDWAGFAVTGPPITSVSGSWTEPTVTCPTTSLQQSAAWVGIDGYLDSTVEQIGTDADCLKKTKKVPGGPAYYAWFEMFPSTLVVLDPTTYPVAPHDALSASVSVVGTTYTLSIVDAGHWSFSTTQPGGTGSALPLNASAEWIVEAPLTKSGKPVKLADFGSVAFTGATVNSVPVNTLGLTDNLITMAKTLTGKKLKASTSALDGTGHSFTVTWIAN